MDESNLSTSPLWEQQFKLDKFFFHASKEPPSNFDDEVRGFSDFGDSILALAEAVVPFVSRKALDKSTTLFPLHFITRRPLSVTSATFVHSRFSSEAKRKKIYDELIKRSTAFLLGGDEARLLPFLYMARVCLSRLFNISSI